jgi:hypothetical protein
VADAEAEQGLKTPLFSAILSEPGDFDDLPARLQAAENLDFLRRECGKVRMGIRAPPLPAQTGLPGWACSTEVQVAQGFCGEPVASLSGMVTELGQHRRGFLWTSGFGRFTPCVYVE